MLKVIQARHTLAVKMVKRISLIRFLATLLFISFSIATAEVNNPCVLCDDCISKDAAVTDVDCSKCARNGYLYFPCNEKNLCQCDPSKTPKKECDSAVSTDGVTKNSVCADLCSANDSKFDQICTLERYTFVDNVELLDKACFTTNIYGYEDRGQMAAGDHPWNERGVLVQGVASASQCQELCQKDDTCVYFSWRHTSDKANPSDAGNCLLKTKDMVTEAALVPMAPRPAEVEDPNWSGHVQQDDEYYQWYKWCDMGLRYECYFNHYECLKCPDTICAYKSGYHVSGPKFCGFETSDCAPIPDKCAFCYDGSFTTTTESPCGCDCYDEDEEVPSEPDCPCTRKEGVDVLVLHDNTLTGNVLLDAKDIISLTHALRKDHRRVRVGLATFSDKPLKPYGSPLSRDYCYRLESPLAREANVVAKVFQNIEQVSGGDSKENQLGAIISSVQDSEVVWKYNKRYVVLVTNGEYHVAGDAADLKTANPKSTDPCTSQDYPTEEEVAMVLKKAGVTPIIVATPKNVPAYEKLAKTIDAGSVIDLSTVDFSEAVAGAIGH